MRARPLFENAPFDGPHDETDAALRAHFDRMPDDKAREYDPAWSDEELMAWDGDFRNDGCLMLVCCDRDVEAPEYRRVLEEYLRFRGLTHGQPASTKQSRDRQGP